MVLKRSLPLVFLGMLLAAPAAQSAIVSLQLTGGFFQDQTGSAIPTGALFQMVNLGANGVFDPINLGDGTTSGLAQWVSGDDSVVNVALINAPPDVTTPAAFDSAQGLGTPGVLDRFFQLDTAQLAPNTKIGIRWFPSLAASNFGSIVLAGNEFYGEFTRQATGSSIAEPASLRPADNLRLYSGAEQGYALWVVTDGGTVDLDQMFSIDSSVPNSDPADISRSMRQVIVPEPATIALSFMGLTAVLAIRRRRH
jgi:hypothetical protein